jgi:MFS family permease
LSILIPVLPFIAQQYSTSAFTVTALSGIYAAAAFFAAPLLGNISDRTGRRPVLIASVIGSAVGYFIFGLGGALWVLFLSRLIDGVSGGNFSTASAYIADVSAPQERAKNFAIIGIAFGLGFILGPALGGLTSQISLNAPAYTAGALALVSVVLMVYMLPESLPPERRVKKPMGPREFNPLASISDIAAKPGMPILLLVSCVFAFAFNGVNTTFGKYVADIFVASPLQVSLLFVFGGIVTLVTQSKMVQPAVKRWGEKPMTIVALLGLALGVLLIFLAPAYWTLFPTALLRNGVGGVFWATMNALTTSKVQPFEQGKLAGVNTALQNLMAVFGPFAAGFAYDAVAPGAPFWIGAILYTLAALLVLGVKVLPKSAAQATAWGK